MFMRVATMRACAMLLTACMLFEFPSSAISQVSIGFGLPSVTIGINVAVFPSLIPVPGYPVYYDPRLDSNLFFYDGLYWVYSEDNWYASSWYNGPWDLIAPPMVPDFVLRVPLRFYRRPPPYFMGWDRNAPPRWDEHWGRDWEERRHGWDHWDHASIPERAPLPLYQRKYVRDRYPTPERQRDLLERNYRYRPHDEVVRGHFERGLEPLQRGESLGREHQPPVGPSSDDARHDAQGPPVRRRVPSPPSRDTARRAEPGRRTPVDQGSSKLQTPSGRGLSNPPSPGSPTQPTGRPPTSERRLQSAPASRTAVPAPRSQPGRPPPGPKASERRVPAQRSARDAPPSGPRTDNPIP